MSFRRLPLHNEYKALGAHFADFSGWEVPVYFTGVIEEHNVVRTGVGFFDVSHMGEIHIRGKQSLDLLQLIVCNDVSKLTDGQALYTPLMLPSGGIVDDILIYRVGAEHYFLIVNAANIEKDLSWIVKNNSFDTQVEDVSGKRGIFAIQGPNSPAVIEAIFGSSATNLGYYHFKKDSFLNKDVILSRTGYTGEVGFEIFFDRDQSEELHRELFEKGKAAGLKHIGFGARDILRLEACFPLYSHELTEETTPLEAGLGWTVRLEKSDFLGKFILSRQKEVGVEKKLVGLEMVGRGIPRNGYPVLKQGETIGTVTSGGYSPSTGKNIGLAYVPAESAQLGSTIEIKIRNQTIEARIVKMPFYKKRR